MADDAGLKCRVNDLELRRLALKYRLAQLNVQLLENPANFVTLMDSMQRQIDRLGDEILTLDQRITRLESDR